MTPITHRPHTRNTVQPNEWAVGTGSDFLLLGDWQEQAQMLTQELPKQEDAPARGKATSVSPTELRICSYVCLAGPI